MKTFALRKKKDVSQAIFALQVQLSRATGDLGARMGAILQFVGQAQTTTNVAVQHAQVAREGSAQMRSMIDETLRAHFAHTTQATLEKLDEVASSLARQLVLVTEDLQHDLNEVSGC